VICVKIPSGKPEGIFLSGAFLYTAGDRAAGGPDVIGLQAAGAFQIREDLGTV